MVDFKRAALVAAASTLFASASAQAIEMQAGEWKFSVSGNVNVNYIYSSCESADDAAAIVTVGSACVEGVGDDTNSSVSNGLLPAAIVFGMSTTQKGYDVGVNFGFYPGISTNDGGSPNLQASAPLNTALGTTGLDVRQVFATIGNADIGTFTLGRNFGLFGFDAIINDMTLIGVGVGGAMSGPTPANTSLGSIGFGYIYTDTLAQMNYTTPDLSGLKLTVGIFDPIEPILAATPSAKQAPGLHGKLNYTVDGGGLKGLLWASLITQEQVDVNGEGNDYTSTGVDLGAKLGAGPFEGMVYYYTGEGMGTTGLFILSDDGAGNARDSDGYLIQGTFKAGDTKFGLNYGVSSLDHAGSADAAAVPNLLKDNSKITAGVYHSLTPNVTLLGEYSDITTEAHDGGENTSSTINVGAFVSF